MAATTALRAPVRPRATESSAKDPRQIARHINELGNALDSLVAGANTAFANSSSGASFVAGGDLSGTPTVQTVIAINGTAVRPAPVAGSLLQATSPTTSAWVSPVAGGTSVPFANLQNHHLLWYNGADIASNLQTSNGWKQITYSGTGAAVAATGGSKLNGTRRTKYSATSSGQLGVYEGLNGAGGFYAWRGDASGRGGFKYVARFAVVSSGGSSVWLHHHGLGVFPGSPGYTDHLTDHSVPRVTLTQTYTTSSGAIPNGTKWKVSECNGSANTITDTGIAIVHGNLVEFILFCAPHGTVTWTLNDVTAGLTASGSCTTTPPSTTTFMNPSAHVGLSVGVATCELDVASLYLEMFD